MAVLRVEEMTARNGCPTRGGDDSQEWLSYSGSLMRFLEKGETPRIKICGLTSGENAQDIVAAAVDAIGVNFWPRSKRYVEPERAADWLGELAGAVCRVGVFVNPGFEEVEELVDRCVLDAIQLHGEESPGFVDKTAAFGLPVIKAFGVAEEAPIEQIRDFPEGPVLLDAHAPVEKGGTGRTFRWDLFRQVAEAFPDRFCILAGGLTPENVSRAVVEARPHAVDVAGGVECSPGIKDPERVRELVARVRESGRDAPVDSP